MKNLMLKMVSKSVITSENANKLLKLSKNLDPVWKGIASGMIDEVKLAKFYEMEGYPVIYEEGNSTIRHDYFARFFTPDIIAKYLVFPISFKKESKDIIIGFINSANIESVKQVIHQVFPDFNTTFFHVPYSIFRKVVYKNFMFDITKYASVLLDKKNTNKVSTELKGDDNIVYQKLRDMAETIYIFNIEKNTVVYKGESMTSRFPLKSLPTIEKGLQHHYIEFSADSGISKLSHTEKIMFFTNMGMKREDRVSILVPREEPVTFFYFLLNPHKSKRELESVLYVEEPVQEES